VETEQSILSDSEINHLMKMNIIKALKSCNGKIYGINGAAHLLECAPTTLCSRIKKYKIDLREIKQLS